MSGINSESSPSRRVVTNAEIKENATRMAHEISDLRRTALRTAFQTFILNPSQPNYDVLTGCMHTYQQARTSQSMVAEWPGDDGPFIS